MLWKYFFVSCPPRYLKEYSFLTSYQGLPSALLARTECIWRWVWSIGGVILTGENRNTQRETWTGAMLSATNLTYSCYVGYKASFDVVPCSVFDRCQCFRGTWCPPFLTVCRCTWQSSIYQNVGTSVTKFHQIVYGHNINNCECENNKYYVELILEINKTVIVASSWSSIFILPTLMMHGQTQIKQIVCFMQHFANCVFF
jgi:hypothetical protein